MTTGRGLDSLENSFRLQAKQVHWGWEVGDGLTRGLTAHLHGMLHACNNAAVCCSTLSWLRSYTLHCSELRQQVLQQEGPTLRRKVLLPSSEYILPSRKRQYVKLNVWNPPVRAHCVHRVTFEKVPVAACHYYCPAIAGDTCCKADRQTDWYDDSFGSFPLG